MTSTMSRRGAMRTASMGVAAALAWGGGMRGARAALPGDTQPDGAPPAGGGGPLDAIRAAVRDPHAPFTLVVRFGVAAGMEGRLAALVDGVVAGTAGEDGVVQYDFHRSTTSPGQFVLIEQWRSLADIEAHFLFDGPRVVLRALWNESQTKRPVVALGRLEGT